MCHITNQLKRHWSLIARIGLSGGLVVLLAKKLDWHGMRNAVQNLDWSWWIAGLGVFFTLHTLCSVRWWMLLHPLERGAKMLRCWLLYFEGMFFSLCLPSTIGGDVVKAFRVSPTKSGRVLAMCSMIADRVSGLIAVIIIGLSAIAMRNWKLELWQTLGLGSAMFLGSCAAAWLGLSSIEFVTGKLADGSRVKKSLMMLDPYHARPILICRAIAISLVIQFFNALSVCFLGNALGIQLTLATYCEVVPIVALLVVAPISVSGIGLREGAMVYFLSEYGVSKETGALLGVTWFSLNVVAGLLGVIFYMASPAVKIERGELDTELEHEKELMPKAA